MNNHKSFNNVYSRGAMTQAATKRVVGGTVAEQNVLQRAIVTDIKRYQELDPDQAIIAPQYSIKARVIGGNQNKDSVATLTASNNDQWYAPLMPIHMIALPEKGEEVLIIRESTKQHSKGFWITRTNETSVVNGYIRKEQTSSGKQQDIGLNINPYDLRNNEKSISPSKNNYKYGIPVYYGDVIQQGRSNTFVRHSFNPRTKLGVLEMGITEKRLYKNEEVDNIATIGKTETKTIHLSKGKLEDIGTLKKYAPNGDENNDRNIICNISEEIYNISNSELADRTLYRSVLGDLLLEFQESMINNNIEVLETLENLNETFLRLMDVFVNHTHVLPEINIEIPDKEVKFYDQVRLPNKTIRRPDRRVTFQTGLKRGDGRLVKETISIPQPPLVVQGGIKRQLRKKTIEFDKITIGGEGEERETTAPVDDENVVNINTELQEIFNKYKKEISTFEDLLLQKEDILSRVNFIN